MSLENKLCEGYLNDCECDTCHAYRVKHVQDQGEKLKEIILKYANQFEMKDDE